MLLVQPDDIVHGAGFPGELAMSVGVFKPAKKLLAPPDFYIIA